jgi:aerobic carbon-monoxide dehydrogenase large subunit
MMRKDRGDGLQPEEPAPGASPWVGRGMRRREDQALLRGQASYVSNMRLDGMVYMAIARSPVAHARILKIDVTAAKAAVGVISVLSAKDIAPVVAPMPVTSREGADLAPVPVTLLAREKVRFVGEPVAAVVAESRARALDALELIDVDYEPLPALLDPREAAHTDIVLHDGIDDNVLLRWARSQGDAGEAFRSATVVRGRFCVPRLIASPLEGRGCVVSYDTSSDFLTLWCSAQDPHRPRRELETVLRRPAGRTRALVPDVGGAFGGKGGLFPEYAVAAVAAMRLGRPVSWVEDRNENFIGSYHGRGIDADVELAVRADGRFLALRGRLLADLGAYLYPVTAVSPTCAGIMLTGAYDIPTASVEVLGIATNKAPTGPYRGAGRPEAAFVIERLADMAARRLGMDPAEIRRRNLVDKAAFPYRNALGYTYDSGDYAAALSRVQERLPYADWRAVQSARRAEGRLIGIGLAVFVDRAGPGLWERAKISVRPSGIVAVIGASPHGQGHETTFAQIVADALGVSPVDVEVRHGDSSELEGMGTYGSRSVPVCGSALVEAAEEVKEQAKRVVSSVLEVDTRDLVWADGRYQVAGSPEFGLTLMQAARAAADAPALPPDTPRTLEATSRFTLPGLVFPFGAHAAVVEVDRETGMVSLLRLATVDDAGTLVNPLLAEGQVHGSVAQGIAAALWEEMSYDEEGQPLTASFAEYGIPSAADLASIEVSGEFQMTPSPFNHLGAKGIGESGTIGVPAAIANAVIDALASFGIEHADLPYTPEKVWRLLRAADEQGDS